MVFLPAPEASGQAVSSATISGTVADPTGAFIPNADVHLAGVTLEQHTDRIGRFSFTVAPGTYTVLVEVPEFETYTSRPLTVAAKEQIHLPVRLNVAGRIEEISVGSGLGTSLQGSTDPNENGSRLVFEGAGLNFLSDDNATLQQQLSALAGPRLGPGGAQFLINGFSGGRLPPKSSIRSIRISQNPYSAYYDSPGFGRVEIQTRPGADKLHGALNFAGTDNVLNARNPYDFGTLPPYYQFQSDGNLNGPINKKTSFFLSETIQQIANNAVVNAVNPADISSSLSEALPAPQHTLTFSARLDHQFSPSNFGYLREEWSQTHITNSGIAPLVLPDAAFASSTSTNTLQISDTQILGSRAVNEVRLQYIRTRLRQDPNSNAPATIVEGSFQAGGNLAQELQDHQDRFELQDLVEFEHHAHAVRAGIRLRELRDSNSSTANFNGEFIFPYLTYDPLTDGPIDYSYATGLPSQFNITLGRPNALLWNGDVGVFAEDDWKPTKNLTVSYGLRVESESAIPDHFDPAPRLGLAWSLHRGKAPAPLATVRAGYGVFYDRFPAANLLQAIRQNGTAEIAYFVQNPDFYPTIPAAAELTATQPTIYRVNPDLRSSYMQVGSIGVERGLGRIGSLSSVLLVVHGTHGFLSQNVNAPLPGTYNPALANSGVRPLGTTQNIYQFNSDSNLNDEVWSTNLTLQITRRLFVYAVYSLQRGYSESSGSTSFPSNQYNVAADYARQSDNRTNLLNAAASWTLPHGFALTAFGLAHSGSPFDITLDTDLNGDTIFNDRPAFATDLSRPSVVRTAFGNFDTDPQPGQQIIPRNYGNSPGYIWLDLQASKGFRVGPRPQGNAATGPGTTAKVPAKLDRPWELKFQIEAQNVLNHNNPGLPVGVLPSPGEPLCTGFAATSSCSFFGRSLSLANEISPLSASNRTILVQSFFTF